jgi:mono/diheme cytochrome c family protein
LEKSNTYVNLHDEKMTIDSINLKYSIMMICKSLNSKLLIFLSFLFIANIAFAADKEKGKTLFLNNCASCHNKNMKDKLTGPALGGAVERWGDDKALYAWIRNSQGLIAKGQPRAVAIWNEYKPTVMSSFPNYTDDDIANTLAYIDDQYKNGGAKAVAAGGTTTTNAGGEKEGNSLVFYGVLSLLLAGLVYLLARIINNLNDINTTNAGKEPQARSFTKLVTSRAFLTLTTLAFIIIGGYTMVNNAVSLGRQQNYAPTQPIKFSHATHAGTHKIDCNYCHDGARRSKSALIPGTNTCMNCHAAINKGSQYGTEEISKIYASIGYNPLTSTYVENYANLTEKEVGDVYKKWVTTKYVEDKKLTALDQSGAEYVESVWSNIKSSLKNEIKDKVQGPIEWKRIHNLPDHVYFNHAQHVTVGKVACQKCHGQVEKMEVMKQYAPLSMGWCINCHRETEVKFKDNAYYASYASLHEQLKSGKKDKVTVADIGGLECQKCHY